MDAKELYQKAILEHGKAPKNEGPLATTTHEATLKNPLCGDRVTLRLDVQAGVVVAAKFEARGCMITRASASLLTENVRGKTLEEALALAESVEALVATPDPLADLGTLEPLRGARDFPARRACVTLPWKALKDALS